MSARFGWCLDGHHDHCRVEFSDHGRRYRRGCPCHDREDDR